MNILIVAPFCSLPGEAYFNRFLYLAEFLSKDANVVLLTSSFRHFDKAHRIPPAENGRFELVLIEEPGYRKNISFARVWSHWRFVKNFKDWMGKSFAERQFDIVYSAFPLLETNILLGKSKSRYRFQLIVDVQDVWPEAISGAIPFIKRLPRRFIPFSKKADRAYSMADKLIAVSETYLQRARDANSSSAGMVAYIGADARRLRSVAPRALADGEIHFVYIGMVGHSYDLETVVRGFSRLHVEGRSVCLHILGDGPGLQKLKDIAAPVVKFYGFLPHEEMIAIAKGSDFFINPIKSSAAQSVTNKLADYILLEKPIISSQTNIEVRRLLDDVSSIFYEAGDVKDFVRAVKFAASGVTIAPTPKSVLEKFDRELTYSRIRDFLLPRTCE